MSNQISQGYHEVCIATIESGQQDGIGLRWQIRKGSNMLLS